MKSRKYVVVLTGMIVLAGAVTAWTNREANADTNKTARPTVVVYKSPTCGCCKKWVEHLKENGFQVSSENVDDLSAIKKRYGIKENIRSCHTAIIGQYIVEGHVPAQDIKRMLREQPGIRGISAPGMPLGSPGMEVEISKSFNVLSFDKSGKIEIYSKH
ncbi:MAG: hypothetical protein BMS9Abin33_0153 [Gammaproteobacteria bacterium]|nr:MAG: hypothetical protein BMS9Abin33_0153 [Gammaproteobacteria bacterium]